MHVWPGEIRPTGPFLEWHAKIECRFAHSRSLWFRTPASNASLLSDSADSFAIAAIFSAMRHADSLHVHGPVSNTLFANLGEFQAAWSRWRPRSYRVVDLRADMETEASPGTDSRAILAFSGGLDSCFSAWRHTQGTDHRLRQEIASGLMVHGFDIPLSQPKAFDSAAANSREILRSAGLELLTLATNFRELGDNWEDAHGAAILSCLHLLKGGYGGGVVASSHVYESLRLPWGSNPVTDPLLQTKNFSVSHDGCGYSRREKARAVASWPAAMDRLRVCWEGPDQDKNCGRCLRCIGTAICFAAERVPIPPTLAVGELATSIDDLGRTRLKPVAVTRLSELLADARAAGIDDPWVESLEALVSRKRKGIQFSLPKFPRHVGSRSLKRVLNRLRIARF